MKNKISCTPKSIGIKKIALALLLLTSGPLVGRAQVWVPDQGDGTYKNPIIYADYSDPDVIRVGDDYYMVASSFTTQPGIPVLHSKDLVNWEIINHVYRALPFEKYEEPQHGQGSWAPSIRFHKGIYYVYFCTPEEGLFVATTSDPGQKWDLHHVQDVEDWEDPTPFWDDDGQAYLLRGKVGGGPAILHRMSDNGKKLLDDGAVIYKNLEDQPILEGFKFMEKRNGYYYFTVPAGGVPTGWQSVFRSKNIYGPYEAKIVLHQGNTDINGPHQGGLVETQTGGWWFIHFQDKGPYGRIVHLQPVKWENGWPIMGIDQNNDGIGEPVDTYKKPDVGKRYPANVPQTSDEFDKPDLGLQWQWQAAPDSNWYSLHPDEGYIRLNAISVPSEQGQLQFVGNLLLQKVPAPSFSATTELKLNASSAGERAGLVIMGNYHTYISLEKTKKGHHIAVYEGKRGKHIYLPPDELAGLDVDQDYAWFRVHVYSDATCSYEYSLDGEAYHPLGDRYPMKAGTWIGAKVGLFCINPSLFPGDGYADFQFFEVVRE